MVRINYQAPYFDGTNYIEGACKSTDSKPTAGIATGSVLIEVDTGKAFMYEESSATWKELGGGS